MTRHSPDLRVGTTSGEDRAPLSLASVAERAGVERSFVQRLVDVGILVPDHDGSFSPGDVRRIILVRTFEQAGVAVDGIGAAVRSGVLSLSFADTPSYERFADLSPITYAELSAETGVPIELLAVIRRAIGGPPPKSDDRVRDDERRVVPLVELLLESGFRPAAVERWLVVYGDSLRRVAETEEDYFGSELMGRLVATSGSAAKAWSKAHELSPRLAAAGEDALLAIYHAHQARSWTRGILEFVESSLEAAGLHARPERVPAICFLDITGYTRLTEERGDEAAVDLADRLSRIVQRVASKHRGEAVKWLGDGVMFHFPDPTAGVLAAVEMANAVRDAGLPPAHIGLEAGPVLFAEGDYFGRTVNAASRIADHARPGEVLVTRRIVDASEGGQITFEEIGPVQLKGLAEPIVLYAVAGTTEVPG